MYHYFAAAEIYNAIRVFIAAYVWMTGFGNFSYYYIRKDFSLARFTQVISTVSISVVDEVKAYVSVSNSRCSSYLLLLPDDVAS